MFTSLASLGLLIGGLGRIGMSVLNFLFNYLIKKQEIKLKELSLKEELSNQETFRESRNVSNNPSSNSRINTCTFKCKFDPNIIEDNNIKPIDLKPLEIEQPKRFYFITIIFVVAVIGVIGATILMYLNYGDLNMIQNNINNLFDHCWVVIGFIVSWVLTDKATNIFKK